MATPHVSGVAALIHAMGVTDPADVSTILMRSATRMPHDARNDYGAGKLNAYAALKLSQNPERPMPNWFDQWRDRGYIDARLWLDEEEIAAPAKLLMAGLTLLFAWSLGQLGWNGMTWVGMLVGSCGLFLLRGVYLLDVSQIPFRILGSTLSDFGSVLNGDPMLNPVTTSALIPVLLGLLSLKIPVLKPGAIGLSLGMTASLLVYAMTDPRLKWIDSPSMATLFLACNSLLCWAGARYLALPWSEFIQGMIRPWPLSTWNNWNNRPKNLAKNPSRRRAARGGKRVVKPSVVKMADVKTVAKRKRGDR
jgi:serine protease